MPHGGIVHGMTYLKRALHPKTEIGKLIRDSVMVMLGSISATIAADPGSFGVPQASVPLAGTILLYVTRKLRGEAP